MPAAPFRPLALLLCSAVMLAGCTAGMRSKFDAAWETVDPMGHRSEHQARHYPRGRSTGMSMPDNGLLVTPQLPGSDSRVPLPRP